MTKSNRRFPPVAPLHVNVETSSDEKPHELTVECWCRPSIVTNRESGTVVNHSGRMRPAAKAATAFERRFHGLTRTSPATHHLDRKIG